LLTRFSFLVYASEKDMGGRYYNKSLDEVGRLTLVRDRTGLAGVEEEEESEPEEQRSSMAVLPDRGPDVHLNDDLGAEPDPDLSKTQRQLDLEDEWGLHRSSAATPESDVEKTAERDNDSWQADDDTDEEKHQVSEKGTV